MIASCALAGLATASVVAVRFAVGGEAAYALTRALVEAQETGKPVAADRLTQLHASLAEAVRWSPSDPSVHELLVTSLGDSTTTGLRNQDAGRELSTALRLRPVSATSWANFAGQRYEVGDTGPVFETALRRAVELGRNEAEVQRTVAFYGLAVLDEVAPVTRAAIERAVVSGMRWDGRPIMRIAQRRGRLGVVCNMYSQSPRPEKKWIQLCQSMEASS